MVTEGWVRALVAEAGRQGEAARLRAVDAMAREAEPLGVTAAVDGAGLRLRGPGLRARVFGSRRRPPDPRLAWLAAWFQSGGG